MLQEYTRGALIEPELNQDTLRGATLKVHKPQRQQLVGLPGLKL